MAISSAEAIEMYEATKQYNVKTMVAYNYRKNASSVISEKFIEAETSVKY